MIKVLQINSVYKNGSTGILVKALHEAYLDYGFDSFVLFGRGNKVNDAKVNKFASNLEPKINSVISRFTGVMYGGSPIATRRLLSLINKISPDVIHIHCTNTFICNNFKLFNFIGKKHFKVIFTLHAEYLFTGSCSHSLECNQWINGCKKCPDKKRSSRSLFFDRTKSSWNKMFKSISSIDINNRRIVAVSSWLAKRAHLSRTFGYDKIRIIGNGIDTSIFHKRKILNADLQKIKNDGRRHFLFVAPDFSLKKNNIKGCDYFLSVIDILRDDDNISFIVTGRNKENYDFSKHKNIIYLGEIIDNDVMAQIYSLCDATILLSRRETYSMVTIESLSCGTPVIGFYAGGPETIVGNEYVNFVMQGDINSIVDIIKKAKKPNFDIGKRFSYDNMSSEYISLIKELI